MAEIRNFEIITVLFNLIHEGKIVKSNAMKDSWGWAWLYVTYSSLSSTIDDSGGMTHVPATYP